MAQRDPLSPDKMEKKDSNISDSSKSLLRSRQTLTFLKPPLLARHASPDGSRGDDKDGDGSGHFVDVKGSVNVKDGVDSNDGVGVKDGANDKDGTDGKGGGNNNHNAALQEFHCFPRLPPEIRQEIWRESFPGPRVVKLCRVRSFELKLSNPQPVQLWVNQEAREEAKRSYLLFPFPGDIGKDYDGHHSYVNPRTDTIFISAFNLGGDERSAQWIESVITSVNKKDLSAVQRLEIRDIPTKGKGKRYGGKLIDDLATARHHFGAKIGTLSLFPGLKTLVLTQYNATWESENPSEELIRKWNISMRNIKKGAQARLGKYKKYFLDNKVPVVEVRLFEPLPVTWAPGRP